MIVKNKKGFTLVELLAVIVILFVVLAIAVPVISNIVKSSTKNAFESDIKMVLKTVELKLLEDKLFDPSIVNESNVKELFNIDDSRYQSLNIQRVDNKLYITVVGKGKWNDLNACGTKTDLRLVEDIKVCNTDIIPPVITILGEKSVNIYLGETYEDAGATAIDNVDGDITDKIVVSGDVNPNLTGEYTLTYNVIDNAGNVTSVTRTVIVIRGDYNMAKGVNYPVLAPGMTPIKWNGTAESNTIENDSTWYDYSAKKWANAKTADGSYWVWIPRFIYNISSGWNTSDAGEVKIQFSKGTNDNWNSSSIGNIDTGTTSNASNNKWINHPVFTFGDMELTGIWVAKFEASNSNNNVKIVPNVSAWTYMYINDFFNKARSMETNNVYGW